MPPLRCIGIYEEDGEHKRAQGDVFDLNKRSSPYPPAFDIHMLRVAIKHIKFIYSF